MPRLVTSHLEIVRGQVEHILALAKRDAGVPGIRAIGHAIRAWHTPRVWPPAPPEIYGAPTFGYAEQLVELLKDPTLEEAEVSELAGVIVEQALGPQRKPPA